MCPQGIFCLAFGDPLSSPSGSAPAAPAGYTKVYPRRVAVHGLPQCTGGACNAHLAWACTRCWQGNSHCHDSFVVRWMGARCCTTLPVLPPALALHRGGGWLPAVCVSTPVSSFVCMRHKCVTLPATERLPVQPMPACLILALLAASQHTVTSRSQVSGSTGALSCNQ